MIDPHSTTRIIKDLQIQIEPPACCYCYWYKRKDQLSGFCVPLLKVVCAWAVCPYYKEVNIHDPQLLSLL